MGGDSNCAAGGIKCFFQMFQEVKRAFERIVAMSWLSPFGQAAIEWTPLLKGWRRTLTLRFRAPSLASALFRLALLIIVQGLAKAIV
jgi:hypothetical protein